MKKVYRGTCLLTDGDGLADRVGIRTVHGTGVIRKDAAHIGGFSYD